MKVSLINTIPSNILDDIQKTGYTITSIHKHGKYHILKLYRNLDLNWDAKDFMRFGWVFWSTSLDKKVVRLKIKF